MTETTDIKPAGELGNGSTERTTRDPERTRASILAAATQEFAAKGLEGARTDDIARRAGANKRMIYHYFGSKEGLFQAVLEDTYAEIRGSEAALQLTSRDPVEAMGQLVAFSFDWFLKHPEFVKLLNEENLHGAAHVRASNVARSLNMPLVELISELLERGAKSGQFRTGVDPVQLYISIAGISYFYFSNRYTLSAIFNRQLEAPGALRERREHVVDIILGYLRP
ncbi:MAG: TetR/AcrR family transcriptional regulator [Pseudomonadota bacterium]